MYLSESEMEMKFENSFDFVFITPPSEHFG